ncbi:lathosterol oxidase [Patella vulgata]|uniref:lathosterol oxidase n=1 Tax=Patella vulgata TaxID=6465 RepID=UPI00217F6006|nr:lathosterol oxidase [Patella vulgata]
MDIVLDICDQYFFTPYVYPADWVEDNPLRQIISLLVIGNVGGYLLYLIVASLSYKFIYDKRLMEHPQFLKNQIALEITCACTSIPWMSIPTVAMFFLEIRGYSKLYDCVDDWKFGWYGIIWSIVTFILFTDMCIYWIHRWLHHKLVYKHLHKIHHKWKVTTPFASHAFHPLDGFVQSLPYHIYPFLFPLHKITYLVLFIFVNIWSVSIHDGDYRVPTSFKPYVNGSAHHTDHHLFYSFNYGQFFTLWDKMGGSFRVPSAFQGSGPLDEVLKIKSKTLEQNGHAKSKHFTNGVKKSD